MPLVTLLPSQQVIPVEPGQTILDAGLRAGLNLPHSCKAGHCSSCRARLVEGRVFYARGRPLGLLEHEESQGDVLLCQAQAGSASLTIQVREIRRSTEIQLKNLPCRIERMSSLAPDVMQIALRLPANEQFTFYAGQYLDVLLSQNRRRSFSIANPPHDAALIELHVRRVAGGEFSEQLFTSLKEKSLLRIEGPLGQFWFDESSPRPAILIGGGTGYAPLRAILRHLLERGDQRALHLYWGAQGRIDLYEDALVRDWARRYANLTYTPVLSAPRSEDQWQSRTGWVHAAALQDHPDLHNFDVYASGPPAMVEAVRHEFIERGLPSEQLFFDSFDYAPDTLAKLQP